MFYNKCNKCKYNLNCIYIENIKFKVTYREYYIK